MNQIDKFRPKVLTICMCEKGTYYTEVVVKIFCDALNESDWYRIDVPLRTIDHLDKLLGATIWRRICFWFRCYPQFHPHSNNRSLFIIHS